MKNLILAAVMLLLFSPLAWAANITARDGTVYKNVEVTAVEWDGIRITHEDGSAKLMWEDVPQDVQQKYHYDPVKVAAIRKQMADAKALEQKKIADAQAEQQHQAVLEQQRAADEIKQQQAAELAQQQSVAQAQAQAQQKQQDDLRVAREKKEADDRIEFYKMLAVVVGILIVYFFPTYVGRKKSNSSAIFLLNLFLGWSFIGWVVALVWAATKDHEPAR